MNELDSEEKARAWMVSKIWRAKHLSVLGAEMKLVCIYIINIWKVYSSLPGILLVIKNEPVMLSVIQ